MSRRSQRSRNWIDISQPVDASIGVWPGDTPFTVNFTWKMEEGAACNVSRVITSPHNGTHADAPLHFLPGAEGIGEVDLDPYLGPCWVAEGPRSGQVGIEHLQGIDYERYPRLLVRTRDENRRDFTPDFVSISVEAATSLAASGARLVGLDTPSMDPCDSKDMPAHHRLLGGGVALLENLWLAGVDPGPYELIALPLRWSGLDASPVRALLRPLS